MMVHGSWFGKALVLLGLVAAGTAVDACNGGSAQEEAPQTGVSRQRLATTTSPVPGATYMDGATVLNDGRVLAAGGVTKDGTNAVASNAAALFDPATNQWLATGSLGVARSEATAILLSDGRVLVSGGHTMSQSLASNEVYNPATETFSSVFGNLVVPRFGHSAVLLGDGRVMVAGGATGSTEAQRAEIIGGSLVYGWVGPWHGRVTLTRATDQSILALYDDQAWIFDETTGTWSQTAGPLLPRRGQKVLQLEDGRLLMLGGEVSVPNPSGIGTTTAPTDLVELFDPHTGTWSATGSLSRPSDLADDLVGIPGGDALLIGSKLRVERYSATAGTWTLLEPLTQSPTAAVALANGKVLVMEVGAAAGSAYVPTAEVYDPASPACTKTTCAQKGASCGAIDDGCGDVLLCGSCGTGQICLSNHCTCTAATTCATQNRNCGAMPDGCGNTLDCGACVTGQTCTSSGQCCTPTSCAAQGKNCGTISDGCGGTLSCGTCTASQICGSNNVCVTSPPPSGCVHSECASGVKLTSTCSECAQKVCGADGYCCNTAWDSICVNEAKSMCTVCSSTCTPTTCAALGKNCGSVSNGCGGTLSCGTCATGQTCTNNVCTTNPTPGTCAHAQCTTGVKLTSGCTPCVTSICAVDSYCCNSAWDSICVSEVASVCKLSCP